MLLILGMADILAALLLVRGFYHFSVPDIVIIFFAAYLFIKAVIFIFDIASLMDIIAGILLLISLSTAVPPPLLFIFAGFLGLKGVMSLFGGSLGS